MSKPLQEATVGVVWKICGLKSKKEIDLSSIVVLTKVASKDGGGSGKDKSYGTLDPGQLIENYQDADVETFRLVSSRLLAKLKYKVDEILPTYRENDGVDFLAH